MAASSTSVKGFTFKKSLNGLEHPAIQEFLLDDSATFTLGDMVRLDTDGLLVVNGAGNSILGLLVGIVDRNGINVFETGRASGTDGSTLTPDDTITTSSTNSTNAARYLKGQVIVDPAGTNLLYNKASAALAQTNVGQCFDLTASGDQVDQGTATDASAQVQLLALDPDDTTGGYFRIVEEQY